MAPRRQAAGLLVATASALTLLSIAAVAQTTQLPGLIVTVPPAPQPQPQPPPQPPAQAAPKKPPAPKAPPRTEAKATDQDGSGARGSGRPIGTGQSIVVLVNDDPITGFEVDQRARLLALSANIGERAQENMKRLAASDDTTQRWRDMVQQIVRDNQGKSRDQIMAIIEQRRASFGESLRQQAVESARASVLPGLRKTALEELIDERLKLQEAKRLLVVADEADVDNVVRGIAKRNNMNDAQFAEHMRKMGADVTAMKARFRAMLSWNEVVRRRFGRDVLVNQLEIDRLVNQNATKGEVDVELDVQRVVLQVGQLDQRDFAARIAEAERLRRNFKGCRSIQSLVTGVPNASVENMGARKASAFSEPARTLLLNAREGEMLPPNPGAGVIELYALCGRKTVAADDKARNEAAAEIRQKEFELLARRHLRDLRQDAHIEYR
jgi:peptidyl-prolyl cis-trans isomerase SurA